MALSPTETGAEPPAELPSASSPFPATQQTRINREIEMSWRMPAETEPQARVRMAFPPRASYVADDVGVADRGRTASALAAHTMVLAADNFAGGRGIHCITQQEPASNRGVTT